MFCELGSKSNGFRVGTRKTEACSLMKFDTVDKTTFDTGLDEDVIGVLDQYSCFNRHYKALERTSH